MRRNPEIGPGAYAVVIVILFGYFAWILDRMAAFSRHGFLRLDKLIAGLGIIVLTLGVVVLVEVVHRRRPHDD